MTTQTIGIEVTANTGAAKRAFDDLGAAIRETTTASDVQGESQKTLAQKIAATKEQQLAAVEAVQRAQRALAEHNATVAAHGRESAEAAESLGRLRSAQAEAAKQSAAAEAALAEVTQETANAIRESDKLTPALARAAREVRATGTSAERTASDVRKLDLAIMAAAKASDVQGEAQRALAQKIAATKEQQLGAADAVRQSQRALVAYNDIVSRYGKESREAAEALSRLRAAQAEAARQAAATDRALEATARQLDAMAKTADARTAPALQRMDEQLVRISNDADRSASELRTLDARMKLMAGSTSSLGDAARDSGDGIALMGALGKSAGALGLAALAGAAVGAAGALREASGEVLSFNTAAGNLPFGIDRARASTRGLITDMQLTASAAQGVAFGVVQTEEEFATLAEAAVKLGIKFKLGPEQALGDMMTALGRGSSEILDNLGVSLKLTEAYDRFAASIGKTAKDLTEAEKKVAFKTEALKALKAAADETTLEADSAAAAIQRLGVRSDNAKMSLKSLAVEGAGQAALALEKIEHAASAERIAERLDLEREYVDEMRRRQNAERAAQEARLRFQQELGKSHLELTEEELRAQERLAEAARERGHTLGALDGELLEHWTTVKDFTASLWDQVDAYAQATTKAREHAEAQKAAEDALWEMLEKRNAKLEQQAIEDAFIAANMIGPELPPGFQRDKPGKKKSKKKDKTDGTGSPVSRAIDFEAGEGASTVLSFEAEVAAYEREKELREARLADMDREIEALEARGQAAEDLIDQRLAAEMRLARWQEEHAITHAEREAAITRREQVEHKRRLAGLRRAAADEAKVLEEREAVVAKVTEATTQLGDAMVTGLERAAAGEKGAIASMLEELLRGTAKKHAVLALAEAALAVGAAASYRYAAAAQHGTAAALHTGVAAAAGVGAYAAGQVATARQGGGGGSGPSGFSAPRGLPSGGSGGSSGGRDDGLEAQEIPVSHEQLRRADSSAGGSGGHTVILQGGTFVGVGGMTQVVDMIEKELDRRARRGARPKN